MAEEDLFPGGREDRPRRPQDGKPSSGAGRSPRSLTLRSGGSIGRVSRSPGSFLNRVNKAVAKAHASKGTNRYSKSKPKTGRFNARGRGRRAYANGIGPKKGWQVHGGIKYRARRVIVKARVSKLRGGGSRAAYAHLKYLQRDGADIERTTDEHGNEVERERSGRLYDAFSNEVDDRGFLERTEQSFDGKGDRHQFRLIVSPEDTELLHPREGNLRYFTRQLMGQMEEDLGTRLDWVAVDHFDTSHPHAHVVIRGQTDDGKILNIAGNYIGHGIRGRAEEIATRELGLKSELQITRDLTRQVEQMRPTSLDRALARHAGEEMLADLRPGVQTGSHLSGITRHHLIGRAKHLSKMGLAEEVQRGRWQLKDGFTDTLQQIESLRERSFAVQRAMKRHNISRRVREHGAEELARPVIGRVIGKGLGHDELSGRVRLVVDGADGFVHGVEVDGDTRAGEAREGALVEIGPLRLRKVDQTIWEESKNTGSPGYYHEYVHRIRIDDDFRERGLSEAKAGAHHKVHMRRLEALARAGIVSRDSDQGFWKIPEDFEARVLAYDRARGRGSGLTLLSQHGLEAQLGANGATWLDRAQTKLDMETLRPSGYGREVRDALAKRQRWLIAEGLAERVEDGMVAYSKGYLQKLEAREVSETGQKMATEIGKGWKPVSRGDRIEGTYTGRVELASGPYAKIETQRSFSLVPWRDVLERSRGQRVMGRVLERSISWEMGRQRGLSR